ncbi:MAG: hypothetical protein QF917_01195 [Candidatus Woesearchaeota archaeon]|jgi:hypothetical protein|nr:hypothetical protein [Candidatus Woesearchaeota archaeon]|tara:strand:+ start:736 stop:1173 length:438 start_codon:yes stop_codon:yes gene_type:complete
MPQKKLFLFYAFLFILTVLTLSLYYLVVYDSQAPSADNFFPNPELYSGQKLEFAGRVLNHTNDYFYMKTNQRILKVYYPALNPPKFGQIEVITVLNADGTLTAAAVHNSDFNYFKYLLSLLTIPLFLFIFFREWKIKNWRFRQNA